MKTTIKQLESVKNLLNKFTDNPLTPYEGKGETFEQHAGHYYIGKAYGGYRLEQLGEHGARDISPRLSKSELFQWMHAYLNGIQTGKELKK